jgi:hypothetical protein
MSPHLHLSPDALSRELDGEVLVLDLKTSLYFGMTGTAARIWQLLEAGQAEDDIIQTLVREYNAERHAIAADVESFLADLIARGLVTRGTA